MIFIKDTAPAPGLAVKHMGDFLNVLEITRLKPSLVRFRATHAADHPERLKRRQPDEMINVAGHGD